ncbi:helix-turn-helix transcriptional regulator [Micromonospora sp. WMMD1082]|uniref:helix-turn-helix domain-containing protein n=1 Tax=Micromonospora sp. WMMD1082 TaxID=3016104 RepID=UPI0024178899|nr:helix-turn-helix transcriptional regulator [Micromonospora sp. WMMD1082]MDG4797190.1 helix-turn-helix transcriptional regulator [Micromonospora sp. WMMD1082]
MGQQIKEIREGAGITLKQAGEYLERDPSTVSRFESAEYPIRRADLLALLDFYSVSDQRRRAGLLTLREEVWQKGWWDGFADAVDRRFIDYVWLESRAQAIHSFDGTLLPGLLQTSPYAEAAIRAADPDLGDEQVMRAVELRIMRQQVLTGDEPTQLHAILDEALLLRTALKPEAMRDQLRHLSECAHRPNIEIRVLPFKAGAHASPAGAFKVFTMVEPYPDVAYTETLGGAIYVETPGAERFVQTYDRLQRVTLTPEESAERISAATEEIT